MTLKEVTMATTATLYRVVKQTTIGSGDEASKKREVVWEGSDLIGLSREYPPSEIFGADELGHHEIEGGHIRWDYDFEKLEGDQWVRCDDPRVRLQEGLSELEREIDAENRRMFPGDYLEEPCSYCGYESCDGECPEAELALVKCGDCGKFLDDCEKTACPLCGACKCDGRCEESWNFGWSLHHGPTREQLRQAKQALERGDCESLTLFFSLHEEDEDGGLVHVTELALFQNGPSWSFEGTQWCKDANHPEGGQSPVRGRWNPEAESGQIEFKIPNLTT